VDAQAKQQLLLGRARQKRRKSPDRALTATRISSPFAAAFAKGVDAECHDNLHSEEAQRAQPVRHGFSCCCCCCEALLAL